MRDRTVLITGGTGGIGKETARGLAALGATTFLVGRDPDRAAAAAAELRAATGNPAVTALTADVARGEDVRRLVQTLTERIDRLDVLVNNAAANPPRRMSTEEGVEVAFATNVLAPFRLGRGLSELLRSGGRIVNLTGGIPKGRLELDNLRAEKRFVGFTFAQYNHTKLAVMAMSLEFARRAFSQGVTVNVAYPGHAATPGNRGLPMSAFPVVYRPAAPLLRWFGPRLLGGASVAKASRSSVYLASSAAVSGVTGSYYDKHCRPTGWPSTVLDPVRQEAVWELCERLDGGERGGEMAGD